MSIMDARRYKCDVVGCYEDIFVTNIVRHPGDAHLTYYHLCPKHANRVGEYNKLQTEWVRARDAWHAANPPHRT